MLFLARRTPKKGHEKNRKLKCLLQDLKTGGEYTAGHRKSLKLEGTRDGGTRDHVNSSKEVTL